MYIFLTNNGYGYQGSGNDIAKSIAAKTNWAPYSLAGTPGNDLTSNNSSGFSGLPGGYRHMNGSFYDAGFGANWWSATNYLSSYAYYWSVYYNNNTLNRLNAQRTHGASVRCIRDGTGRSHSFLPVNLLIIKNISDKNEK